jgi:hypothetical protein
LFSTNKEFCRTSISIVFHWSSSENFNVFVLFSTEVMFDKMLFNWFLVWSHIPPEDTSICGSRNTLFSCFTSSEPVNFVNWIMMGVFKCCNYLWFNNSWWVTNLLVKEA